jgi:predicted histidine transporter YuiF (NhaC family)
MKISRLKISQQNQEAIKSYLRSAIAAVVAVIATIDYEMIDIAKAFVAALIPPVLRWINPKDTTFGRGSDGEEA